MNKALLATALALVVPSLVNAQPMPYPTTGDAPRTLDPGAPEPRPAPPPAPAAPAQPPQPNVVVVGPDGKVTYGAGAGAPAAKPGAGYYYGPSDTFGMDEGNEPDQLHVGPTPELHVVRTGDTLWDICQYYFGDPWQWPKVWSYNPQITNPHWIYPGDLVRLLPKGVFVEQPATANTEPEKTPGEAPPPDNLPPPAKSNNASLKQTAFVEKSNIDKAIKVDGAVDEKELLSIGDSIYLSYPSDNAPKVGQRYSVYKPIDKVKASGKDVGAYVRLLGTVEVASVKQDKRARAVIVEANQEITRGDLVGPLLKTFQNVPPVQPKVDAQGTIVAMLTKDQLIGKGEVVFVDLGKASGIENGNRMFVVRRGDALPPKSKDTIGQDDRRFPARRLGEIIIVEVGDKVSIGLITVSVQDMAIGDLVMMQKSE